MANAAPTAPLDTLKLHMAIQERHRLDLANGFASPHVMFIALAEVYAAEVNIASTEAVDLLALDDNTRVAALKNRRASILGSARGPCGSNAAGPPRTGEPERQRCCAGEPRGRRAEHERARGR